MIKSELIQQIAEDNPHLYQRDVERIVSTIFDEISDALARGDRVELRGFGAFSVKLRGRQYYHVVPGRFSVGRVLTTRRFHTALPGTSFKRRGFRLIDNEPDLRDPYLTLPLQLRGGKGIAHTITRVLIPVDL